MNNKQMIEASEDILSWSYDLQNAIEEKNLSDVEDTLFSIFKSSSEFLERIFDSKNKKRKIERRCK